MGLAKIDTLSIAQQLISVGVERKQAEAHAKIQSETIGMLIDDVLATKQDLHEAKRELKAEIQEVRAELKADFTDLKYNMERLENKLTIKMFGAMAAGVSFLAALMTVLHFH